MAIEFRLLSSTGAETVVLPDVESFSLSPVLCDAGAIEFSYPKNGTNWASIKDLDEFSLAVYIDGVRQPRLDAVIKDVDGDDVDDDAVWKFTGYFGNGRLQEALTYPKGWPSSVDPKLPNQSFATATAGTIVGTLMQQAQARGTLSGITYNSFSSTTDSNGVAWNKTISIEYAPQVDYLELLQNLYVQRMCEFEMVGNDLRLYVADSMSVDRTTGATPLVFRKGRDLSDSPRKRSTRDLGTVVLAAGNEGLYLERVNAPAVAARRRIEAKASSGQISDSGTLSAYGDAELARIVSPKMEKTHGLVFGDNSSPRPIRDFNVGDWAYSDMGNGLERLRIKQWVLSYGADGKLTGSTTLNDFFAEEQEYLSRRIDGIVGGSTITGGSRAVDTVPAEVVDNLAPATPTGLGLTSVAYVDNQGQTFAQVTASWLQTTTNSDGTILSDLAGYRLRWRYAALDPNSWSYVDPGVNTATSWSPVTPNVQIYAQIQAYDKVGNASAWSASVGPFLTGKDATPPEAPSAPVVNSYLGLLRTVWDGKTASGAAWAPDLNFVEVHISTVDNFTPDLTANSTTRVDALSVKGESFQRTNYYAIYYVKLVAVDHSGNYSTPSAQGSSFSVPVVSGDIFDGAVGSAKLADLAVTTAKINLLAVNDAQIGNVSVGKLTAGVINAQVTISGRIATALTGKRVEMNSVGFQGWDASNNQTISLDGVSNLLVGKYRSAIAGRRIEMGSTGLLGELNFYSDDGDNSFVRSYTEGTGVEAIQIGMKDPTTSALLWNRININSDRWFNLQSEKLDFTYASTWRKDGTGGFFMIREATGTAGASSVQRLGIGNTGFDFWRNTTGTTIRPGLAIRDTGSFEIWRRRGQSFRVWDDMGTTQEPRVNITDTDIWWEWPEGNQRLLFRPAQVLSGSYTSPGIQFVNAANGGVVLRAYTDLGTTNNPRIEVRDVNDTGWGAVHASAFNAQSSAESKTDIQPVTFTAMDKIRPVKAKKFRRRQWEMGKDGGKPVEGEPGRPEIGVIAEELPAELRVDAETGPLWNISATLAIVVAALGELDSRLAQVELLAPGDGKVKTK